MKLYDYFRSSACYRVRIALQLKGLPYSTIPINLLQNDQRSAEHLRRNPQGFVPALEHNGNLLTQSLAICEYLDEAFPNTPLLLPGTALERATIRSLAQSITSDIHPLNNLRVLQYLVNELGADETQKLAWYRHWIVQGFDALESRLAGLAATGFCGSEQPTLADVCLVPQVYNALRFDVDLTPFPHILAIYRHCLTLEAFINAQPE